MTQTLRFTVKEEHAGLRIDQAISAHLPQVSRTRAKKVLSTGGVFLNKKRVKIAGRVVYAGQMVEVNLSDEGLLSQLKDEVCPEIPIVAETSLYLVVDKPSGVFSGPTKETDKNNLLSFLSQRRGATSSKSQAFFLVHRLDRPTSGLMVIAKTKDSAAHLSEQVAARTMSRKYLAILVGELTKSVTVEKSIQEKFARTIFTPLEHRHGLTLVEAQLETGRTHQVRIHAESLGCPVAGDSKYGRRLQRSLHTRPPRMALHAQLLSFVDPETKETKRFERDLPENLLEWWQAARSNPQES